MPHRNKRVRIQQEARVLFTLLDAADDDRLLVDDRVREAWKQAKEKVKRTDVEDAAEELFELLVELEATGALRNTWMLARWHGARQRIESTRHDSGE